jgi:excisionase family DNA binding protein
MKTTEEITVTPHDCKPMGIIEVAEFTGLSRAYIYKLICLKKIPHYKPLGGRVFFKREELEQFIFRGKQSADYELSEQANGILNGTAPEVRS